jgi:succinate dehydrogenase / fumarate reductase, cytochrome b subunit
MSWFGDFYRSALGKKVVMAATGVVLWGFVLTHMAGNLKIFLGAESLNHYAEWLRDMGQPLLPRTGLLWIARLVLIASVALHAHAAWALTMMNRRARPQDYARRDNQAANFAARTMRWTGVALLLFVVYHLLHFTWGTAHPDFIAGDVYHNLTTAFANLGIAALYVVAMLFLGLHLWHGLWSLFQSLGWSHAAWNPWRRTFAVTFAVLVALGFLVVPVVIAAGMIR